MQNVTRKILVVDDDETLCQFLAKRLAAEGLEVVTTLSAAEALALVAREQPDLVILDLVLPRMDGIETLRRIRERGWAGKVVVFTAYGTADRAREALALGAREFIGKPFDLDRLIRVVAEQVGGTPP